MRCTKALIFKENLKHNILAVKKLLKPDTKICCAVKADGYGCGAVLAARTAQECGADYLAVATADEAAELRKNGITAHILLLSLCTKQEFPELIENNVTPLIFDSEMIQAYNKAAAQKKTQEKQPVFLAIDTGMGRIGCLPDEAAAVAQEISECSNIALSGVITHFAVADSITKENRLYTEEQFRRFMQAVHSIEAAGINPGIRTCANSAAAVSLPQMQLDMVRPGIVIYGYYPDAVTEKYLAENGINLSLKPVMQLETEVVAIRRFTPGRSVSYGRTWTSSTETDIAVLPIGYADGLLRRNSPGLLVTINGRPYPVIGRICMDQCMVDIGLNNPDVKRWDKAIIFGPKESGAVMDASDIAEMTGTISYEIMTAVSKRVPRIIQ